ncbi:hypothetical protein TorRG33x02_345570 [Trema orientale]|uniref:Uncharacterized protein n=1 Tax=Trema orientale TaxID=63057 RepID=A0A2P5ANW8_TREOI|nr:hypothetical protein TorRG33x02_345570 [Trema orientale]
MHPKIFGQDIGNNCSVKPFQRGLLRQNISCRSDIIGNLISSKLSRSDLDMKTTSLLLTLENRVLASPEAFAEACGYCVDHYLGWTLKA